MTDIIRHTCRRLRLVPIRTGMVVGLSLLSVFALSGCAAFRPIEAVPAHYLPEELKGRSRENERLIDLSRLRQRPVAEYIVDSGDVLAIYIEGVLGQREAPPINQSFDVTRPPTLGYPLTVRDDGTLSLPLINPIIARGRTLTQIEDAVRYAYTIERRLLQPGRDRILVSLHQQRMYRVLVVRQEQTTEQLTSVNLRNGTLGSAKKGTGRIVALPAYKNDVLNALVASGGLPGLDAQNVVYVIRSPRPQRPAPRPAPPMPQQMMPGPTLYNSAAPYPTPVMTVPPQAVGPAMPGGGPQPMLPQSPVQQMGYWETSKANRQQPDIQLAGGICDPIPGHGPSPTCPNQQPCSPNSLQGCFQGRGPRTGLIPNPNGGGGGTTSTPYTVSPSDITTTSYSVPGGLASSSLGGSFADDPSGVMQTGWQPPTTWNNVDAIARGEMCSSGQTIRIPLRVECCDQANFSEQDVILDDGDIVFIESRDAEVFYTGGLLGGGQFNLPRDHDLDILQAIAIAQSTGSGNGSAFGKSALNQDVTISASQAVVLRHLPNGDQLPILVDLYKARKYPGERIRILPGDYIILQYTKTEAIGAFVERHILESALLGVAASNFQNNRR